MCLYSLYARDGNTRKAKVGESLTRGEYRHHACFLGDDGKLACIKHGSSVEIAVLVLQKCSVPNSDYLKWNGKTQVRGTFVRYESGYYTRHYSADAILLEDGYRIHMDWMHKGVQMRIPRKVRKDKGIAKPRNLMKALGLDQIRADIPVTEKVGV